MNKQRTQQQLYIIFWIVIAVLIGLIGWFTYVLIRPDSTTTNTASTKQANTNTNTVTEKKSKKTNNSNSTNDNANTNTNITNSSADTNTATDDTAAQDGGLVEPTTNTNDATDDTTTNTNEAADEASTNATTDDTNTKTVMLYFPKSDSACGEVAAVERKIEPSDDIYGQIILETMHGPTAEESGYTNAVPSDMYLRQVEYTADGALITVSEAYDSLDSCDQKTAAAQLIETANAMFELPTGTAGEVVVGTTTDDETDTDTNENTNEDTSTEDSLEDSE
ncbi:MAG: hypothetical protein ACD_43C00148G0001 [uncultured bacterium]|nr:MAG: hypothetical protein ACD_43C00148G0001 [uncultured bacterium]